MTDILSELEKQLLSCAEVLITYSDENISIVNQYKWEEYIFYCDVDTWTIQWEGTEFTINICEVANASYDEVDDTYTLEFNSGNGMSISIMN